MLQFGHRNNDAVALPPGPCEFGHIFAKGQIPDGKSIGLRDANGNLTPTQCNIRTRWPDGSVLFAKFFGETPEYAGAGRVDYELVATTKTPAPVDGGARIPNITATVKFLDGTSIVVDSAACTFAQKLTGPLATEYTGHGPASDLLEIYFDVTTFQNFPTKPYVKVRVENTWIQNAAPAIQQFDIEVAIDGVVVCNEASINQLSHVRFRKTFNKSPIQPMFDFKYWVSTGLIANYDFAQLATETDILNWIAKASTPEASALLGQGPIYPGWGATGYRADLALLMAQHVTYIQTQDPRLWKMALDIGECAGHFNLAYRDKATGRPCTPASHPQFSAHINFQNKPQGELKQITNGFVTKLKAEDAHAPSLSYLPYLITGDDYYLDGLKFQSFWSCSGTAPGTHGFEKGLVTWMETRGVGWSIREIRRTALVMPDDDPDKPALVFQYESNLDDLLANYMDDVAYPYNTLHVLNHLAPNAPDMRLAAPWQNDYLATVVGEGVRMGNPKERQIMEWMSRYTIGRLLGDGADWRMAAAYHVVAYGIPNDTQPMTWAYAQSETYRVVGDPLPTELVDNTLFVKGNDAHYAWYMLAALAEQVASDIPNARQAYDKLFTANASFVKKGPVSAEWAILPVRAVAVAGPQDIDPPVDDGTGTGDQDPPPVTDPPDDGTGTGDQDPPPVTDPPDDGTGDQDPPPVTDPPDDGTGTGDQDPPPVTDPPDDGTGTGDQDPPPVTDPPDDGTGTGDQDPPPVTDPPDDGTGTGDQDPPPVTDPPDDGTGTGDQDPPPVTDPPDDGTGTGDQDPPPVTDPPDDGGTGDQDPPPVTDPPDDGGTGDQDPPPVTDPIVTPMSLPISIEIPGLGRFDCVLTGTLTQAVAATTT